MKKLIAALALCVGTAAFANDTAADQAQKQDKTDTTHVFTQQPGDSIREAQQDANKGIDATQVGPKIANTAKDIVGIQTEDEGTFKTAKAFTMTGTLKDKTLEGVTIERKGLPAADLDIRDKTALWLDGKKVSKTDALPEGAQVRAKFQLEGQDIVAVELHATSPKGLKNKSSTSKPAPVNENGTGGSGLRNDARQLGSDVKSGAKDTGNTVKNGAQDVTNDAQNKAEDLRDDLNK